MNEWFETDYLQWCKKIDNMIFKFCQVIWLDTCGDDERASNAKDDSDNYCVVAAVINLWDYDEQDVLSILSSFGYSSFQEVNDIYGNGATQIMAECVFEQDCLCDPYVVSKEVLSKEDAEEFAENWMKEN